MEKNNNQFSYGRGPGYSRPPNMQQGRQGRSVAEDRKFKERIMECDWIKDEAGGICGEDVEYVEEEEMKQVPHRHIGVVLAHH